MSPNGTIAAAVAGSRRAKTDWAAHRLALEVERLRAEGVIGQAAIARALTEREVPTPGGEGVLDRYNRGRDSRGQGPERIYSSLAPEMRTSSAHFGISAVWNR